ncbi:MAG: hypothetical protein ABI480_10865 [Chitinophagaceae bacterium]
MSIKKSFETFWQAFIHPRVFIFILTGTAIIFLTFLTDNDAMEIAISGIASVFIGIGVNNYSSFETNLSNEKKLASRIGHSLKILELAKSQIARIHHELKNGNKQYVKTGIAELEDFMTLSIELIKEGNL